MPVLPPAPPTMGLLPCDKPDLPQRMTESEVVLALIRHRAAIDQCESRRRLMAESWRG